MFINSQKNGVHGKYVLLIVAYLFFMQSCIVDNKKHVNNNHEETRIVENESGINQIPGFDLAYIQDDVWFGKVLLKYDGTHRTVIDKEDHRLSIFPLGNRALLYEERYKILSKELGHKKDSIVQRKVEIYTSDRKRILTTIDIQANFPFSKKEFPGIVYNSGVGGEGVSGILRTDQSEDFYKLKARSFKATSWPQNIDDRLIAMHYNLELVDEKGKSLGLLTTIMIMDTLGSVLLNHRVNSVSVRSYVCPDNRFLVYVYGGNNAVNVRDIGYPGFCIIEIETGKKIFNYESEFKNSKFSTVWGRTQKEKERKDYFIVNELAPIVQDERINIHVLYPKSGYFISCNVSNKEWLNAVNDRIANDGILGYFTKCDTILFDL